MTVAEPRVKALRPHSSAEPHPQAANAVDPVPEVTWRIRLLGGFEIYGPAGRVEVPPSAQRVVAYLALQKHAGVRTAVAMHVWPDVEEARARANLRSTVYRLGALAAVVAATSRSLTIAPGVSIDLQDLEEHVAAARAGTGVVSGHLRGFDLELLPGWEEEWVQLERERVRQLELHLLDDVVASHVEQGRHGEAIDAALRAIRVDPLRDSSHAALLRALLAAGDRAAAITHFRQFAVLLREQLGLAPSSELMELTEEIFPRRRARRSQLNQIPGNPPRDDLVNSPAPAATPTTSAEAPMVAG